jgi:Domain of unknown function (DUF4149)
MQPSFVKPSSASPSTDVAVGAAGPLVQRIAATLALLAIAVWMGGLVALGALAAPVVFSTVPLALAADAMTVVFRRFDLVAMSCSAIVLATEAASVMGRAPLGPAARARVAVSVFAVALAVLQGLHVSPHIAALHAAGALRGTGAAGAELARWHDLAEACGKGQLALLAAAIALHVFALAGRASIPRLPGPASPG